MLKLFMAAGDECVCERDGVHGHPMVRGPRGNEDRRVLAVLAGGKPAGNQATERRTRDIRRCRPDLVQNGGERMLLEGASNMLQNFRIPCKF